MEMSEKTRVHWPLLSVNEQAFVAAYVTNAYSVKSAAEVTGIAQVTCKQMLGKTDVRKAIAELQSELDEIDFLNEKWVKSQLLNLFPKVMGEEAIPSVDNEGSQVEIRKFYPEIAFKILEYVAPKKKESEDDAPKSFNFTVTMPGAEK
jgi:phage terminase small subunit